MQHTVLTNISLYTLNSYYSMWHIQYHLLPNQWSIELHTILSQSSHCNLGSWFQKVRHISQTSRFTLSLCDTLSPQCAYGSWDYSCFGKQVKLYCKAEVNPWLSGSSLIFVFSLYFNISSLITLNTPTKSTSASASASSSATPRAPRQWRPKAERATPPLRPSAPGTGPHGGGGGPHGASPPRNG